MFVRRSCTSESTYTTYLTPLIIFRVVIITYYDLFLCDLLLCDLLMEITSLALLSCDKQFQCKPSHIHQISIQIDRQTILFSLRYILSYTTIFDGQAIDSYTLYRSFILRIYLYIYMCTKIKIDKISKMIKYINNCGLVTMWLQRDNLKLDKDVYIL